MTAPISADWWKQHLHRLRGLPLLPCGAGAEGKAPVDPSTGGPLAAWQGAGFTPEQIIAMNGAVLSVGCRTGTDAGGLLVLDIDGQSAIDHCRQQGCDPDTIRTWTVRRTTAPDRLKVCFRVPEGLWSHLGKVKRKLATGHGEQIELFFGQGQVLLLGGHRPSGGWYVWPADGGPEAVIEPPPAWWHLILSICHPSDGTVQTVQGTVQGTVQAVAPSPTRPDTYRPPPDAVPLENLLSRELSALFRAGAGKGHRDNEAFRLAVGLLMAAEYAQREGLAVSGTPERLILDFASRCSPPFSEREALAKIRAAQSQPRTPDPNLSKRIRYQLRQQSTSDRIASTPKVTAKAPLRPAVPDDPSFDGDDEDDGPGEILEAVRRLAGHAPADEASLVDVIPPNLATHLATIGSSASYSSSHLLLLFIAGIAGALPIDSRIVASEATDFVEPLVVWIMTVLQSGDGKSTAIKRTVLSHWDSAVANRIETRFHREVYGPWSRLRDAYEADKKSNENPGPEPRMPKSLIGGTFTHQGLAKNAQTMETSPVGKRAVLLAVDEGDDILHQANSKEGRALRGYLNSAYDDLPIVDAKATQGLDYDVKTQRLSIAISVQPEVYRSAMNDSDASGFAARFFIVENEQIRNTFDESPEAVARAKAAKAFLHAVLQHAAAIQSLGLALDPSGQERALAHRRAYEDRRQAANGAERAVVAKLPGKLIRLSGLLHVLDHLDSSPVLSPGEPMVAPRVPREVPGATVDRAAALLAVIGGASSRIGATDPVADLVIRTQRHAYRLGKGQPVSLAALRKAFDSAIRPEPAVLRAIVNALAMEGFGVTLPGTSTRQGLRYQPSRRLDASNQGA